MNETDNKVVSLKFDNSGFAQKVSETRRSLEKLNEDLKLEGAAEGSEEINAYFSNINEQAKKVNVDSVTSSVEKAQSSFKALELIAVGALLNIGGKVTDLGTKMVKSMGFDQAKAGFDKYQSLLKSTQTILATDENLTQDHVNAQLKKLTWYTDETSYAMTDMVNNISQFTNMGINLDDAVQDMIGIGNAAGMAGASVDKASHAMAGFSKAMSLGYMSQQVWNSYIKTSTIGTTKFQEQAIAVAKELGTIKQAEDGLWYSVYKDDVEVGTGGKFVESLTKGKWFTKDVMEATLKRYSKSVDDLYNKYLEYDGKKSTSDIIKEMNGQLDEFSLKAFRLSQEATTFTQAVDSLFDAMSSRWSSIFTHIFGDYEHARELWTELANWLYDTFMPLLDTFEEKVDAWSKTFVRFTRDAKGSITGVVTAREELINGFRNIFEFITKVLEKIGEAWKEVFGVTGIEYFVELTIRFKKWTDQLVNNEQVLDRIKRIAKDIFKFLNFVKGVVITVGNILRKIVWPIVKTIFTFILNIAETIIAVISGIADGIGGFLGFAFGSESKITKVQQIVDDASDSVDSYKESVDDATDSVNNYNEALDKTAEKTEKTTKATEKAAAEIEKYKALYVEHGIDGLIFDENPEHYIEFYKSTLSNIGLSQKTLDKYNKLAQKTGKEVAASGRLFLPYDPNTIFSRLFGSGFKFEDIEELADEGMFNKYSGKDEKILANIEKAKKKGSFYADDYFYYYGGAIKGSEITAYMKALYRDVETSKKVYTKATKSTVANTSTISHSFNKSGILEYIESVYKVLQNIAASANKKVQNSFKKTGEKIEKVYKKVTNTAKSISKNSLLYKSSEGVRKITNKLFTGMDKSFKRTKTNITNFSKGLKTAITTVTKPVSNLFGVFNRGKKVFSGGLLGSKSSSILPGINKSTEKLSKSISKNTENSVDNLKGIDKNAEELTKVYDKASKEPDKLEKIGNAVSSVIENTFGNLTTKMLKKVLGWMGEDTSVLDEKKFGIDEKIKAMSTKIGEAVKNAFSSISWSKVKGVFLDIGGIIKGLFHAIKEFFGIFKKDEQLAVSSSSSALDNTEKKSKSALETITSFLHKVKESIQAFSFYDKETKELKPWAKGIVSIFEKIKLTLLMIALAIVIIFNAIRRIKYEDFVSGWNKFSERVKNSPVGRFFSSLHKLLVLIIEDIDKFGFKETFSNVAFLAAVNVLKIVNFIKEKLSNLKDYISNGIKNINTDAFWDKLKKADGYKKVSDFILNLVGAIRRGISFAISEIIDIIFSKVASYVSTGSADMANEFRHMELYLDGDNVNTGNFDKLKFIFENIFNGVLWNKIAPQATEFIEWFVDSLFGSIQAKLTTIGDTFKSIFTKKKITAEVPTMGASRTAVEPKELSKEMSEVTSDVEDLSIKSEGIDWDKILGGTVFMFTVARIVGAWKYFIKHTAGDTGGVTSIASSVKEIGSAFATIAAGTTILAILSFGASLFIFTKAMETISELDVDSLKKNVEAVSGLLETFAGFIFSIVILNAVLQGALSGMQLYAVIKSKSFIQAPNETGLFGIAGLVFSISIGIAAILLALKKLAEIPPNELEETIGKIRPILIGLGIAMLALVGLAGFLGYITAKNTKVPETIDMGKFNMGNVFQSIQNKNPFQGVPELIKNISVMILTLVGSFLGLMAVVYVLEHTIGKEEFNHILIKAGIILGAIFAAIIIMMSVLLGLINKIAKNAGQQNISKILGNFAWVMVSFGLAIMLIISSIAKLIKNISNAFASNDEFRNASLIAFVFGISVGVFYAVTTIIDKVMDSVLSMAALVDGDAQKGKNMQKVLKAFAKVIKAMISPFKWLFLGIGLMVKLMSGANVATTLSSAAIVLLVMGASVLLIKELVKALTLVINAIQTEKGNVTTLRTDSLKKAMNSLMGILITVFASIIIMTGLVIALAGVIDRMKNPDRMLTAIGIFGIILGGVIVSLVAVIGVIWALKKINIDGKQLWSMTVALVLFLGVVALLAAGMFAGMMVILNKVGDNPEAFKEAGLSTLAVFGAVFLLIALFAGYIVLLDKIKVDWKKFLVFIAGLIAFAFSIDIIAQAFKVMTDAVSTLQDGDFSKIVGLLAGFVAILAILGALTAIPVFGTSFAIGMIAVAVAFDLFAAAIVLLSMAFGIFVVSFERFFDTMLRLPELIPAWQEFLQGLNTQIMPELSTLLHNLQAMVFSLIRGTFTGVWNLVLWGLKYWSDHSEEAVDSTFDIIIGIIDGIANNATRLDASLTNLFTVIGNIIDRHWNNFVSHINGLIDGISNNAVAGFIRGIGSRLGDLWDSGEDMGDSVIEGAQNSLDINSPSKVMEWIGKMAVKGIAKGIGNKEEQSGLYKTASGLKDKLMEALDGAGEDSSLMNGLKEKVQGFIDDQDFTATIKGVLDMDEMTEQMNSLDTESLMGNMDMSSMMNGMDTSALMGDASSAFSNMKMSQDLSGLMNQNGSTGDTYNVTSMQQNNYSPKSLDAATQYRQSKNLVDAGLAQDRANDFKPTGKYTEIRIPVHNGIPGKTR